MIVSIIGVPDLGAEVESIDQPVRRADQARYDAKDAERNDDRCVPRGGMFRPPEADTLASPLYVSPLAPQ